MVFLHQKIQIGVTIEGRPAVRSPVVQIVSLVSSRQPYSGSRVSGKESWIRRLNPQRAGEGERSRGPSQKREKSRNQAKELPSPTLHEEEKHGKPHPFVWKDARPGPEALISYLIQANEVIR